MFIQKIILIFITIFALVACVQSKVTTSEMESASDLNRSNLSQEKNALSFLAKVENDLNKSYEIFQSKASPLLLKKVAMQHQENEKLNKKANCHCKKVASERNDLRDECLFFTKTFWLNKDTASKYQAAVSGLSKQLQLEDLILRNEITVNMKNNQKLYNDLLQSKCLYAQDYARNHQIYVNTLKRYARERHLSL